MCLALVIYPGPPDCAVVTLGTSIPAQAGLLPDNCIFGSPMTPTGNTWEDTPSPSPRSALATVPDLQQSKPFRFVDNGCYMAS